MDKRECVAAIRKSVNEVIWKLRHELDDADCEAYFKLFEVAMISHDYNWQAYCELTAYDTTT